MSDIRTLNGQSGFEKALQLLTAQDWHLKLTKLPRFCQTGFLMKRLDFLNYTAGLWRCISLMQLTGIIYLKLVYFSSLGLFIKISSYFVISVYRVITPALLTTFSSVSNINVLHADVNSHFYFALRKSGRCQAAIACCLRSIQAPWKTSGGGHRAALGHFHSDNLPSTVTLKMDLRVQESHFKHTTMHIPRSLKGTPGETGQNIPRDEERKTSSLLMGSTTCIWDTRRDKLLFSRRAWITKRRPVPKIDFERLEPL